MYVRIHPLWWLNKIHLFVCTDPEPSVAYEYRVYGGESIVVRCVLGHCRHIPAEKHHSFGSIVGSEERRGNSARSAPYSDNSVASDHRTGSLPSSVVQRRVRKQRSRFGVFHLEIQVTRELRRPHRRCIRTLAGRPRLGGRLYRSARLPGANQSVLSRVRDR